MPNEILIYILSLLTDIKSFSSLNLASKKWYCLLDDKLNLIQIFSSRHPEAALKYKNDELNKKEFLEWLSFDSLFQKTPLIKKLYFEGNVPRASNGYYFIFLNEKNKIQINDLDGNSLLEFQAQNQIKKLITVDKIIFTISSFSICSWDFHGHLLNKIEFTDGIEFYDINKDKLMIRKTTEVIIFNLDLCVIAKFWKIEGTPRLFLGSNEIFAVYSDRIGVKGFEASRIEVYEFEKGWKLTIYYSENSTLASFKSDKNRIVAGFGNGLIKIWNKEGDFLTEFKAHKKIVASLEISHGHLISIGKENDPLKFSSMSKRLPPAIFLIKIFDFEGHLLHTLNHQSYQPWIESNDPILKSVDKKLIVENFSYIKVLDLSYKKKQTKSWCNLM